jgi:squalene-hopene/tetraprenyl-beta-curcumene cyclase
MKRRHFILALALAFAGAAALPAADEPLPKSEKNLSFRNEIRDVMNRGYTFLEKQQNPDGSFGTDTAHPALTALPVIAFQREPTGRYAKAPFLPKSYAYLRGFVQPDGGIYNKESGLANYNTSVCLLALANVPGESVDMLTKARTYIVNQQATEMAKPETNGGIGYGNVGASPKRGHPDLDNTLVAMEALRLTQSLASDKPGVKDLNWAAAIDFVTRCQNLPSHNKEKWASGDPANKGGFIYYPGFSNAGEQTLEGGGKALRSYGSMSYAGLLSFVYADLGKDDPRVKAAIEWLGKHYTLDENPGMEKSGYYYYLHLLAKAYTAAGITEIEVNGKKVDWRKELGLKLMALQKQDGSWLNEAPRWKENNSALVTSYCTLTLAIIYNQL